MLNEILCKLLRIGIRLSKIRNANARVRKYLRICRILARKVNPFQAQIRIDRDYLRRIQSKDSILEKLVVEDSSAEESALIIDAGYFRIFNSEPVFIGNKPEWHTDFNADYQFPLKPAPLMRWEIGKGYDCRIPWELSRFQFVPCMLEVSRRKGNSNCIRTIEKLLEDWQINNPRGWGINWASGMEIGLRSINILLFVASDKEFSRKFSSMLWQHLLEIYELDIRKPKRKRHNHILVSAVCAVTLSLAFRNTRSTRILEKACKLLHSEIKHQFRLDGGNFESSSNYHRYSLEAILFLFAVVNSLDEECIPDCLLKLKQDNEILERVDRAIGLSNSFTERFRSSPRIGDQDDARVFFYKDYFNWEPTDHSYLVEMYEIIFSKRFESPRTEGKEGIVYPDSGLCIYSNSSYSICLYSTPVDRLAGGHTHCDKCSMILDVGGFPVFVDSGTGTYIPDPELRNQLRSTEAHNTVSIDEIEQMEIDPTKVFMIPGPLDTVVSMKEGEDVIEFYASHSGYCRRENLNTVERRIWCLGDRINVTDLINGTGEYAVTVNFVVHPAIEIESCKERISLSADLNELCTVLIPSNTKYKLERVPFSERYGDIQETYRISFTRNLELPASLEFEIRITDISLP